MAHHVTGMQSQLGDQVYYQRGPDETTTGGIVDGNDLNLMHQFGPPPTDEHAGGVGVPVGNAVPTAVPGVVVPSSATQAMSAGTHSPTSEPKKKRQPGTKLCPTCSSTIAAALAKCQKCGHVFREKKEKVKRSGKRGKKVCPTCSHENPSACSQCQNCKHIFRLKMIEKYRRHPASAGQTAIHTPQAAAQATQQMHAQRVHQQRLEAQRQQAASVQQQGRQGVVAGQQVATSQQLSGQSKSQQQAVHAQQQQQAAAAAAQQQTNQQQQQQLQQSQMHNPLMSQQRQQLQHQQAMHHPGVNVSGHMVSGLGQMTPTSHMIAPQQLNAQHLAQHHMAQQGMPSQYITSHMQHMGGHPGLQHHMAPHLQQQQQQHPGMQQQLHTPGQSNSQLHQNQDF
eukprot:Plantae.Rhodophyta-Hildenbrandia_rubra.ctg16338.p1 GENE.Plantae.Rhodophyta-Hildenbrandia_rubra.ctg16338~~Plantae.Rhodophyta-Hildenbrandia_rubra.ctg16338.p1  ORF type:complete len:395 (-),score=92.23 Plantae.Rhodophyta-Hildenbrandia_rubra.ctg16338:583-1767(-)